MDNLTKLDREIHGLLYHKGRMPAFEIAAHLKAPHTAVRNHIRSMEQEGVITGYRVMLDRKLLSYDIKAVIRV